tara:strand:- start:436 stop:1986 length:1551 start_codon:yes stop_codon:yes gene_type:complete
MGLYRYTASADNTIADAFRSNLIGRSTGSNMGAADVLEAFYIVGQTSASSGLSTEKSRILINFPFDSIESDRSASVIPENGKVSWFLRLYNARHASTVPKKFYLTIEPISGSWQEGTGLDMEEYSDQTYNLLTGSNWLSSSNTTKWNSPGGDYAADDPRYLASQLFEDGTEDLNVDVTYAVEKFLHGSGSGLARNGFGIRLSGGYEAGSQTYYTKKFFARSTEYFFKRPVLEARWDSTEKDNAGNFYMSSALAPAEDNLNKLYLYNYIRGQLKDIPTLGHGDLIHVSLHSGSDQNVTPSGDPLALAIGGGVTVDGFQTSSLGGKISTGIYTASVVFPAVSSSITTVFPVWNSGSAVEYGRTEYHTGSAIDILSFNASNFNPNPKYTSRITNLKSSYSRSEKARFRLFVRSRDWNPTVYTVASTEIENTIIEDAYYRIDRIVDGTEVVSYGTGSLIQPEAIETASSFTRLSYDSSGNYFDLHMKMLESGYAYTIKFVFYSNGSYVEQPEVFKFRVED